MVKNIWSKMLSVMLSTVLACALVPAVALADEGNEVTADEAQVISVQSMDELNALALEQLSADGVGVASVSLGGDHSAAIKTDDTLWMWGSNSYGQLGISGGSRTEPVKVLDDVKCISLGTTTSAAVKKDGSLWMWGYNNVGQLGDGTTSNSNTPVKILDGVETVSLGTFHSAAVKTDGTLWTWGDNTYGQLGDGTTAVSVTPIKVLDGVESVSITTATSAALKTDGTLWTWGRNYYGQLGDGTTTDRYTPVKTLGEVASVSLAPSHSAAVKTDGSLWMWGYNNVGQLGDGTMTDKHSPIEVKVMNYVESVSLAGSHSSVITDDGSMLIWGYNYYGQLGNGSKSNNGIPTKVFDNVVSASLGGGHSAALKADGTLWTWGHNDKGQLGDGTTEDKYSPVRIIVNSSSGTSDATDKDQQGGDDDILISISDVGSDYAGSALYIDAASVKNFEKLASTDGLQFFVEEKSNLTEAAKTAVLSLETNVRKIADVLDVKLADSKGQTISIDENAGVTMKVCIAMTDAMKKLKADTLKVYYVGDDGTFEDMNAEVGDTEVVFTTNHFSTYVVTGEAQDSGAGDNTGEQPGEEPGGDQPGEEPSDNPTGDQPGDEPTGDEPGNDPSGDQPGEEPSDNPTGDQPGDDPSGEQPGDNPTDEEPSGEQTGGDQTGDQTGTQTPEPATATQTMYRLYNPNSGEHFYTADANERDSIRKVGWIYEGIAWTAPVKSNTPVYRLYSGTDHHYTTSAAERNMLVNAGWSDEGIGWYSDDAKGVPLYRQFNPNVDPSASFNNSGSHNYTTSKGENDHLVSIGWREEGIGWYGVDLGTGGGSDYGDEYPDDPVFDEPIEVPVVSEEEQAIENVMQYSYEVHPVNGSLNNILFVETDNPDPMSFQLVDEDSVYLEQGESALFTPVVDRYYDIVYTDEDSGRIADAGYLFHCSDCTSDGGSLSLMANVGFYESPSSSGSFTVIYTEPGTNYDTGTNVSCQTLEDRADYLIRTYANGQSDFFDKLDAVQSGLDEIALYPKSDMNTDKPNSSGICYPFLAVSPYWDLDLNEHIEGMYESAGPLFLDSAYGFVLDSLGIPGMMQAVAERLQPSCTVKSGYTHFLVDITYNGQTKTYGGAGAGSTYPLYTKFLAHKFTFDGTDIGFGTNPSMETMREARLKYAAESDAFAESALEKLSSNSIAEVVGDGAWIRCAAEGTSAGTAVLCYAYCNSYGYVSYASDAWVDGRYVNEHECYDDGDVFADHPEADIILRDVAYEDAWGDSYQGNVRYQYDADTDTWRASDSYYGGWGYEDPNFPDVLVLTRSEVNDLLAQGAIDGNTNNPPAAEYIYDGTAEPGTKCF